LVTEIFSQLVTFSYYWTEVHQQATRDLLSFRVQLIAIYHNNFSKFFNCLLILKRVSCNTKVILYSQAILMH